MKKEKIQFYDPHPLLSYDALWNFILDVRGRGKTFSFAKRIPIDKFLENGEQFIYLRRFKTELMDLPTYFTDIEHLYPDHKFEVKGRTFYCDGKVMGFAVNLSTANNKKSVAYPHVTRIIFDEFILEKGFVQYLPNEVNLFNNFYETVARTRDNVKVYFLGNAISLSNPYFTAFKIIPRPDKRFTSVKSFVNDHGVKEHLVLVEIGQDDDNFRDLKKKSRFGMIIEGSQFEEVAVENTFLDAHDSFIMKKEPDSIFRFSITYMGETFGIWYSASTGFMYASKHYSKEGRNFALTTEDYRPNMILIDSYRNANHMKMMKKAFSQGFLMFENTAIRSSMYEILDLIR